MKILVVSNMYPSENDKTFGTFVKVFMDGLTTYRPDYKIDCVLIQGRSKSKLIKLRKYLIFYITLLFKLIFKTYDAIYVHTITFPTPPLRIVSYIKKLPLIFNIHGVDFLTTSKLAGILKMLCIPLLRNCKYVIVPSEYYKDMVLGEFPFLKNQVIVSASGGVESQFYHKSSSINSNPLKIGYVSRITQGKGWDTLIEAIDILINEDINFEVYIVGTGDEREKLEKKLNDPKYNGRVCYLGPIGHDKLSSFYNSLDVFVFPSESESLGLVGLEAMASSVPVIGSDIGGIKTYVEDSVNGFLFHPRDAASLAMKIRKFVSLDNLKRHNLRQTAYVTAENYRSDKVLRLLFDRIFPYEKNEDRGIYS